jgi:hypothetical protein
MEAPSHPGEAGDLALKKAAAWLLFFGFPSGMLFDVYER